MDKETLLRELITFINNNEPLIEVDGNRCSGKPTIAGSRISVAQTLHEIFEGIFEGEDAVFDLGHAIALNLSNLFNFSLEKSYELKQPEPYETWETIKANVKCFIIYIANPKGNKTVVYKNSQTGDVETLSLDMWHSMFKLP